MHIFFLSILYKKIFTEPFFEPHLMPKFLDWKSVQLETETSSLKVPYDGNHASRSYFLAAASFKAPDTILTTL